MLAKCRLQNPKKEVDTFVLVYHEHVEEDSELMKDLDKKYIQSISSKSNIKPKIFKQLCQGSELLDAFILQIFKIKCIIEMDIHVEFTSNYNFAEPAVENLNKLFAKLNEMNRGKKHIIILLDEVMIHYDCIDFSALQLEYPFMTIIIAVNPAGYELTKEVVIIPPSRKNVLAVQLKAKHRNSYQIAVLIAHINKFLIGVKDETYKCLDSSNDKPLVPSNLPNGPLPIWVQRSPETTDEQVLKYLKVNFLQASSNVTLVHSIGKEFTPQTRSWIANENWKVLEFTQMTGSETDVLVAFIEDTYANMEVFSRARKQLIIVTK